MLVLGASQDPRVRGAFGAHPGRGLMGFRGRLLLGVSAELGKQKGLTAGEPLKRFVRGVLLVDVADKAGVDPFYRHRTEGQHVHDVVGRREDVGIPDHQKGTMRGPWDQDEPGLEHRHQRPFAADQRPRHVKAVFGQEIVEVVARDPPRELGVACPDEVRESVAQVPHVAVNLAPSATAVDDVAELLGGGRSDFEAQPVVGQDLE